MKTLQQILRTIFLFSISTCFFLKVESNSPVSKPRNELSPSMSKISDFNHENVFISLPQGSHVGLQTPKKVCITIPSCSPTLSEKRRRGDECYDENLSPSKRARYNLDEADKSPVYSPMKRKLPDNPRSPIVKICNNATTDSHETVNSEAGVVEKQPKANDVYFKFGVMSGVFLVFALLYKKFVHQKLVAFLNARKDAKQRADAIKKDIKKLEDAISSGLISVEDIEAILSKNAEKPKQVSF